ncbi:MAG: SDR family NAD(P)-dependent oxidoreductase [Candidatus Competibacterales bacterium]
MPDSAAAASPQRLILVTGARGGIGRAVVARLVAAGHRVIASSRRPAPGTPQVIPWTVDLADIDALPAHLKELVAAHPEVDGVVCCAGRGQFGALEEFSPPQIRALMDLNFTAHALLVRALIPLFKGRGRGDVVFMGSEAALAGGRRGAVYSASKAALRGFAQALRDESAKAGVRVCTINPGMVRTPFFDGLSFAPGDDPANAVAPEDVAEAVALALEAMPGTVVDEINLSPLKKVVRFKGPVRPSSGEPSPRTSRRGASGDDLPDP